MKFSSLVYLEYKQMKLSESLGSLGFQIFIRDPSGERFLLGKRAHSSEYKPDHYTLPGGMFEVEDSVDSVTKACLREIEEELFLSIDPQTIYLTAILRELSNLGVVLLLECTLDNKIHSKILEQEKITANEEWEEQGVHWYRFTSISKLDHTNLMEGLLFHWMIQNKSDWFS